MGLDRSLGMLGTSLGGMFLGGWLGPALGIGAGLGAGLGWMAGSFIGQLIFPVDTDTRMPPMAKYPIQRSDKGNPITICYGTTRVAGNIIWMGETTSYVVKHTVAEGGLFGEDTYSYETRYKKSFLIAVCEGERYINRMWKGKDLISLSEASIYNGDGVNSGLTTELQTAGMSAEDVRFANYKYLCCALFVDYELGNSEQIPNFTFEVTEKIPYGGYFGAGNAVMRFDTTYETQSYFERQTVNDQYYEVYTDDENDRVLIINDDPDPGGAWFIRSRDLETELVTADGLPGISNWEDVNLCRGCFSGSKNYVYCLVREWNAGLVGDIHLVKWNATSGAIEWFETLDGEINMWVAASDSNDLVYFTEEDHKQEWMPPNGSSRYTYNNEMDRTWVIVIAEHWMEDGVLRPAVLYCGGSAGGETVLAYAYDLPTVVAGVIIDWDSNEFAVCDPGLIEGVDDWNIYDAVVQNQNNNSCLFAVVVDTIAAGTTNRVYKFDHNLDVVKYIELDGAAHIFAIGNSRIGAVYQSGTDAWINVYDLDLTLLSSTESYAGGPGDPTLLWYKGVGSVYSYHPIEGGDANPSWIIEDLLTNERYGCAMPYSRLDTTSFKAIYDYCADNDLLISISLDQSRSILDWMDYVCSHFGGFLYWSGSKIYLGAWKDDNLDFELSRSDLVKQGDQPPVQIRKRKYSETHNRVELTWINRNDNYGPAVAMAADDVDLRVSGKLRKLQIELPGVKRSSLAAKLVWRYLFDSLYRHGIYNFQVGYKHSALQVGRVGLLSDGFKLDSERIRITSIQESENGQYLDIEAVDDIAHLYPDLTDWDAETTLREEDSHVEPSDLLSGLIVFREDLHTQRVYLSVTPQDANCEGWRIFVSRDGTTYTLVTTAGITGVTDGDANSQGTLETALPAATAPTWRGEESITVDIGTVTDLHTDITDNQFFGGQRLAKIGEEIIAYKTCEDLGSGQWKITGLIRGLYQTEPVAHVAGEAFATLDVDASFVFDASDVGATLYFKAACVYGGELQAEADATEFTYSVVGQYIRPFGLSLLRSSAHEDDGGLNRGDYGGVSVDLYWNLCSKLTGFNIGAQDGGGTWEYGDSEADLVHQSGVAYGSYLQDPDLQGVDLVYYESDGTFIGQQSLAIVSTATLTKATDLNNKNPAKIWAYQRQTMRSTRLEEITADDGS